MIIIDTHILIWLVQEPAAISDEATRVIQSERDLGLSAVSCWEVALLAAKKRIDLKDPVERWLDQVLLEHSIRVLPLTREAALMAGGDTSMHWDHADPADRFIVATAIYEQAPLVTGDRTIRRFSQVTTIW